MRRGGRNYLGNYFLRRVLRVYPLFAVALVVHLLLTRLGITTVIETWQDVGATSCCGRARACSGRSRSR
jgi:peptidoglycan/LPS O-acetylase OafA/YrhL